jgi:hypothetical protein
MARVNAVRVLDGLEKLGIAPPAVLKRALQTRDRAAKSLSEARTRASAKLSADLRGQFVEAAYTAMQARKPIPAFGQRIEQAEQRILGEEQKILTTDQHILEQIEQNQTNNRFVSRLYKHRFIVSTVVTIGIILVWKGVEGISANLPFVSTAVGALLVGLLLLWVINSYASNQ